MIEFDTSITRRLPVYLLLDTSGSMVGDPIEALNQGMQLLLSELKKDPMALETAYVSCITFDTEAREILPLTEVGQVSLPKLEANGLTNLGAALRLLLDKMQREVRPNTPEQKGDWKPMVFLMSDGVPTDPEWPTMADKLREQAQRRTANVIALACGQGYDTSILKRITPTVLLMQDQTSDNIRAFFKWVSQSVRVASQKIQDADAGTSPGETLNLPPPPSAIQIVL